jgi:CO/xanthine dehydrogenase Mo-binding subunit
VVAENTWAAFEGKKALDITWNDEEGSTINSEEMRDLVVEQATPSTTQDDRFEAIYEIPFEAHATMEPMNCTADVRAESCEVWAPTQTPQPILGRARAITGLAGDEITVHTTLMGGGFGRRLENDFAGDAIELSKTLGVPIQVVWTRADDMRNDFYHPMSATYVSVTLDENGLPTARPRSRTYPGAGARTGYWRSVGNVPEAFAVGGLTDELAVINGIDAFDLHFELLPESTHSLLELAREKSNWDAPLPEGWGRGLAFHNTWGATPVVQVAEVSIEDDDIRVQRVVCVLDCGTVINPDNVAAQMEGGIVFGLTAALKNGIMLENGAVQESNFHDYPLLQIHEMPGVEVYTIDSDDPPTGVGEMGVPPIAPAVANAIFAATGQRLRQMPFRYTAL